MTVTFKARSSSQEIAYVPDDVVTPQYSSGNDLTTDMANEQVQPQPRKGHKQTEFSRSLEPSLREVLEIFDLDGTGIQLHKVREAAEQWSCSTGDRGSFSLKAFPAALHDELSAFDQNGDGMVDKVELAAAARMYADSKAQALRMRKILVVMSLVICLLLIVMFALTYLAIDMSKEMRASNVGLMQTSDGHIATMGTVARKMDLEDYPQLGMDTLRTTMDITFAHNGEAHYYQVGGIIKTSNEVQIKAASGERIVIHSDGTLSLDGVTVDSAAPGNRDVSNSGRLAVQTTIDDGSKCKSWCAANTNTWEDKCGTMNCIGCQQCAGR